MTDTVLEGKSFLQSYNGLRWKANRLWQNVPGSKGGKNWPEETAMPALKRRIVSLGLGIVERLIADPSTSLGAGR